MSARRRKQNYRHRRQHPSRQGWCAPMLHLFVDADACPVKEEAYRVAARHGMPVYVVTCQSMRDPAREGVTLMSVPAGPDIADDWIAEQIDVGDICVTDDI